MRAMSRVPKYEYVIYDGKISLWQKLNLRSKAVFASFQLTTDGSADASSSTH